MLYISGMQALNLPCNLDTSGDWHRSCMDWNHPALKESEGSIWGDYGIEGPKAIPDNKEKHYVANHIRALLDMLHDRNFADAQGMKDDYIGNDKYDEEIFRQVTKMKDLPYWADIDSFMEREYLLRWVQYKATHCVDAASGEPEKAETTQQRSNKSTIFPTGGLERTKYAKHEAVLLDFLHELNKETEAFVLKGTSALRFCYGLDRESTSLEFDSAKEDVLPYAEKYFHEHKYPYVLDYAKPSYRSGTDKFTIYSWIQNVSEKDVCLRNGIRVYSIERLASMKLAACTDLEGILDLYDFVYICKHYGDKIPHTLTTVWGDFMAYRGMDFLQFHIKRDRSLPIDLRKLKEDVLQLADRLGVQLDSEDFW